MAATEYQKELDADIAKSEEVRASGGDVWTIYRHFLPDGRSYVGQTRFSMESRWKRHVALAEREADGCRRFWRAIKKYGHESFAHQILDICTTSDQANAAEVLWIKFYGCMSPNGFNLSPGGSVSVGNEETRARISDGQKKFWATLTPERRAKKIVDMHHTVLEPCFVCGDPSTITSTRSFNGGNARHPYCLRHKHGVRVSLASCKICGRTCTRRVTHQWTVTGYGPYCEDHKRMTNQPLPPCVECGDPADRGSAKRARQSGGNARCEKHMKRKGPRRIK